MADEEVDPSELFSSPIKPSDLPSRPKTPRTPKTPTPNPNPSNPAKEKEPFDAEEVREAALRRELEGVRNINEVIEGVIGTLERAKGNMGVCFHPFTRLSLPYHIQHTYSPLPVARIIKILTSAFFPSPQSVSQTVTNASTLLNTWTRILSQTEHNQRLLLDRDWHGATRDLEAVEEERLEQQLAAQRRAAEDERRLEERRRAAEEAERKRMAGGSSGAPTAAASAAARGGRGRGVGASGAARGARTARAGRGFLRGGSGTGAAGANASGLGNVSTGSASSRAGSQIGRGFGAGRTTRGTGTRGAGRAVR